jgi:hypothetical protein
MNYNNDFRFDLEFGVLEGETWFADMISNNKFEVKTDRQTEETGNIYIEYQSRGKPSGIKTTQADFWVYKVGPGKAIVIETIELKKRITKLVLEGRAYTNIRGGDNNTSLGVLIRVKDLL